MRGGETVIEPATALERAVESKLEGTLGTDGVGSSGQGANEVAALESP